MIGMNEIVVQLLSAFVGSFGFTLIFHVGKKQLLPAALGGLLAWGVYLLCQHALHFNGFVCTVTAAACAQVYAEILARIYKSPTTVFFIPAAVPLIPGGSLYNTMYAAVFQNWEQCKVYGIQTLEGTLGIAVGLSFIAAIPYILANLAKQKAMK